MANISETLAGRISNLGDEFDQLFNELGKANAGVLKGTVGILGDLTKAMKDAVVTADIAGAKGAGIAGFLQSLFGGQTLSDVIAMGAALDQNSKMIQDTVEEDFIASITDDYKDLLKVMEGFLETLPKLPSEMPFEGVELLPIDTDDILDFRNNYGDLLAQMQDDVNSFNEETKTQDKRTADERLLTAGQLASGLSELAAQGSTEAKALQTSATLIDTYAAAVAAYKSTAAIPIIGPGLAPIAAASAIAFGLAQVKRIQSFAEGGFTGNKHIGFKDQHGPITGVVHQDEFVFNREKTAKLRPFFEDIHNNRINLHELADLTKRGVIQQVLNTNLDTERLESRVDKIYARMKEHKPFYDDERLKVRGNTVYKRK